MTRAICWLSILLGLSLLAMSACAGSGSAAPVDEDDAGVSSEAILRGNNGSNRKGG